MPTYHGEVASRYRYRDGAGEIGVIASGHATVLPHLYARSAVGRRQALHLPVRQPRARTSAYKLALAARMIREGKSYPETADAVGVNKRTIPRWMKEEWFLAMVHGQGVMHDVPAEESWLWIDTSAVPAPAVLGSLLVESATHLRVASCKTSLSAARTWTGPSDITPCPCTIVPAEMSRIGG